MTVAPRQRHLLLALLLTPSFANAFALYPGRLPNGETNSCLNCHTRSTGGGELNSFGVSVQSLPGGSPDWALLFAGDSDTDGFTNGEELGDPCGIWRRGGPAPTFSDVTMPGDDASAPTAHTLPSCIDAGPAAASSSSSSSSSAEATSSGGATSSSAAAPGEEPPKSGCSHSGTPSRAPPLVVVVVVLMLVIARRMVRAR